MIFIAPAFGNKQPVISFVFMMVIEYLPGELRLQPRFRSEQDEEQAVLFASVGLCLCLSVSSVLRTTHTHSLFPFSTLCLAYRDHIPLSPLLVCISLFLARVHSFCLSVSLPSVSTLSFPQAHTIKAL